MNKQEVMDTLKCVLMDMQVDGEPTDQYWKVLRLKDGLERMFNDVQPMDTSNVSIDRKRFAWGWNACLEHVYKELGCE